ncbi:hypothetical protein GCM10010193_32300 [Kitasatospora atroaurantiaca]|uniref:Uncharacterized protein n=1 Tax=Kitasatospora atroaurantiaca TaxID=285545 RepID=A0A561ERG9_9ACTN|nr:hypothetical protein [Kitasatospora atroaurantiaca]TWE18215.1 hypothetical protein FB465_3265 [Kitasatospora atroaurantiaca]
MTRSRSSRPSFLVKIATRAALAVAALALVSTVAAQADPTPAPRTHVAAVASLNDLTWGG